MDWRDSPSRTETLMPKRRSKQRGFAIVANAGAKRRMLELAKSLFDKGLIDAKELAEARRNMRFRKQVDMVCGRMPTIDAYTRAINGSDRYIIEKNVHAFGSASSHLTPADGNVSSDLGFHPDHAKALLADADADERMFKADYARMQHPVFAALSKALERTVPEDAGFGKFRGPPREPDDDKG